MHTGIVRWQILIDPSPANDHENAFDQLLRNARAGDDQATGELLEHARDYLLLIANQDMDRDLQRKLGPSDLVQESMIHAQQNFERFNGETRQELLTWLRGILKNDSRHWRRHYKGVQKRGGEHELAASDSQLVPNEPTDVFYTPSSQAMAEEEEARLQQAIIQLPDHYRNIVQLKSMEEKSFAEIGELIGCSADAARKTWSRAIVRLQELMSNETESTKIERSATHNKKNP